jgi:spore coat polysaccharide biosynthesis protein SpsF
MKTIAIVQARMGSKRLPGKVMMDLGGATVLARVVGRLTKSAKIHEIMVATTLAGSDDTIVRECERLKVPAFRGSESDVLDRYYQAARQCQAGIVVRITSDCPVIDPTLVDETIALFEQEKADYASNTMVLTFPRGLDTEVFNFAGLERVWREGTQSYEREHVTPYFYQHPEHFRLANLNSGGDFSRYRWTVDTPEDLQLVREIYSRFQNKSDFDWRQVLSLFECEPCLADINSGVPQKSLDGA